jgi:hypothetical protein
MRVRHGHATSRSARLFVPDLVVTRTLSLYEAKAMAHWHRQCTGALPHVHCGEHGAHVCTLHLAARSARQDRILEAGVGIGWLGRTPKCRVQVIMQSTRGTTMAHHYYAIHTYIRCPQRHRVELIHSASCPAPTVAPSYAVRDVMPCRALGSAKHAMPRDGLVLPAALAANLPPPV